MPFIFLIFKSFKVPKPAAAKSLAIPLTDKQSDLLGVKFISITGSSNPYIEAMGSPILCFPVNSIMPSCSSDIPNSLSESNIPFDSTPLISDFLRLMLVPGI